MHWGFSRKPLIKPSADLCASLMVTECVGQLSDIRLPLTPLVIVMPKESPMYLTGHRVTDIAVLMFAGNYDNITVLLSNDAGHHQRMWLQTDDGKSCEQAIGDEFPEDHNPEFGDSFNDVDKSMHRFVINLIEYMNTQEPIQSKPRKESLGVLKGCRTHTLGKNVKIPAKMRAAITESAKTGKLLTHRHIRRGHFRRQRHGPKNSQTKTIWLKPTWIGKGLHERTTIERDYEVS
jgi:hypothetical protein